jgi:methylamine dehydrogenase accessory protein MauD
MTTEMLVISNVFLWLMVIALGLIVFALARQIGVLNERVAPAGALTPSRGPRVGELVSTIAVRTLSDTNISVGSERQQDLLLLFVSPTCPVCRTLVPTAQSLARREKLDLLFASDGEPHQQHLDYSRALKIAPTDYVLSEALGRTHEVAKLPFAVLIDRVGVLRAKGLVNTREHLESLIEARDLGVATVQAYLKSDAHGQQATPIRSKVQEGEHRS